MMIPVTTGVRLGLISTATSGTINDGYKKLANVATLYRYRFTILDFDQSKKIKIIKWCEENCLRKVEIIIIQTSKNQWACVCAFEKKIDCVGFKLWW